jgi:hypothetical protein
MTLWRGPPGGSAREHLLAEVPSAAIEVGARLGEEIELAACRLRPERVRPGQPLEVTLYFRVLEPLPREWTVFVHGDQPASGREMRLLSDHPPADGLVPTTAWRPGQIIRDVSEIDVPRDQAPGEYRFFAGLFRDDDGRMPVTAGPDDGDDRVPLGSVTVEP